MLRVSSKVREVSGVQQSDHTRDEVAMGVGLIVFWPALFFLASGDQKAELSRCLRVSTTRWIKQLSRKSAV